MPTTKETQNRIDVKELRAGVERSEPGGRAQRDAGAARAPDAPALAELPAEVRDRLSDELIDELLAGARTPNPRPPAPASTCARPPGALRSTPARPSSSILLCVCSPWA